MFFLRFYLFTFRERGRVGEREKHWCERDTSVGCLSHNPIWGPSPQPRRVPWLALQPATCFLVRRPALNPLSHASQPLISSKYFSNLFIRHDHYPGYLYLGRAQPHFYFSLQLRSFWPWPGSSVGSSIITIHQGCGFNPKSGHIEESNNECIDKFNNKWMSICLSLFPSF